MGWETSNRKSRLPVNWASEIVPAVKKRDGGRCRAILPSGKRCPRPGRDVDHRNPGDDHNLENLQLLCEIHHKRKTAREAIAGKVRQKPSRREPERHPGMV